MQFFTINVSREMIIQAQVIRAERDQRYRNIYGEAKTDVRWVGELGEICFHAWLHTQIQAPITWITQEAAGKADFVLQDRPIGMKTVKRMGPIRPDYTAQMTARHAQEPVDQFFFASYEFPRQRLWLLGGISKQEFVRQAHYYGAGAQVHPNYTIRAGHEIYNIEIAQLIPPLDWIRSLRYEVKKS